MLENQCSNRNGLGHTKANILYNPHGKYVDITDNRLCSLYGINGHFKEICMTTIKSNQKNVERKNNDTLVLH